MTFEVAAPAAVNVGELFRIEFIVNAVKGVEFSPPTIEGLEVMAGPQESRSTNVQMINGNFARTETTTYTYVLQGFSAGLHTISAAVVTIDGATHSTKPVTIEVVGESGASAGSQSPPAGTQNRVTPQSISAEDVFVRAVVSDSDVFKGEPVMVTLKLYSRVPLGGLSDLKPPAFNGFWQQDISSKEPPSPKRESSGNRVYDTWNLMQYLLYPQQSGTLTVEPFTADVVIRLPVQNSSPRNIFDEMMGLAGGGYQDIQKTIVSEGIKVNVQDWPAGAPASFDGAVGDFTLETTPPPSSMKANSSATYTVRLSGTGNFPLIRTPRLELPASFEQYNVTTSDNTRHTPSGTNGYREFAYPFIPRSDGLYTIPAVDFSFFNPRQGRYVTLSSREMSLEVVADTTAVASSGGIVSGLSREELKIFGQDIHFIKRGSPALHPKGRVFMWSPLWIALAVLAVMLFGIGAVILRRHLRNMQSDRFVRSRRANKMALRRFRAAHASMGRGDKHGFYDEMLKALWGYMSDKLDIPPAALSKERIREELFERNIPAEQADTYIRIISECEQAQYSPTPSAQMSELYSEGVAIVSQLEL